MAGNFCRNKYDNNHRVPTRARSSNSRVWAYGPSLGTQEPNFEPISPPENVGFVYGLLRSHKQVFDQNQRHMLSQINEALGDRNTELQQQAANMVGCCRALLNDQLSRSLNRLHRLMVDAFHWCDFDVGLICRLGNRQRAILVLLSDG